MWEFLFWYFAECDSNSDLLLDGTNGSGISPYSVPGYYSLDLHYIDKTTISTVGTITLNKPYIITEMKFLQTDYREKKVEVKFEEADGRETLYTVCLLCFSFI